MLPFGHIAAGYLLSEGFLFFVKPPVSPHEAQWLVGIGTFSSFAPDLDMFHAFVKEGKLQHRGADLFRPPARHPDHRSVADREVPPALQDRAVCLEVRHQQEKELLHIGRQLL